MKKWIKDNLGEGVFVLKQWNNYYLLDSEKVIDDLPILKVEGDKITPIPIYSKEGLELLSKFNFDIEEDDIDG